MPQRGSKASKSKSGTVRTVKDEPSKRSPGRTAPSPDLNENLARFNKSVEAVEEIVETAKRFGPSKTSQAELLSQAKDALRIDSRLERELRAVKRAMMVQLKEDELQSVKN